MSVAPLRPEIHEVFEGSNPRPMERATSCVAVEPLNFPALLKPFTFYV